MNLQELSELTDEELLEEAKKMKSNAIMNAILIGVIIGIAIYSTAKNGISFFSLFILYFAYRAYNNWKANKDLSNILKERNLKY